jgi:galactokinase
VPAGSVTAFAPGRVNLLGEHTDYNGGLVLPLAIEQGVRVRATTLPGPFVMARAKDLHENDTFELHHPTPAAGWRGFLRGAAAELAWAGNKLAPCKLEISGTVPRRRGLGSSSALTVALALALLAHAGIEAPGAEDLARLCARIEGEWAGGRAALLDHLTALTGKAGHALRIDFATLAIEAIPFDLQGWTLAVVPSAERRELAPSDYGERRRECAEAAERLGGDSLSRGQRAAAEQLEEPWRSRALHVLDENARVEAGVRALRQGEMETLGRLMDEAHASLRDCFQIGSEGVERTVARCKDAGAVGARLMGGSVLALFRPGTRVPGGSLAVRPAGGARLGA